MIIPNQFYPNFILKRKQDLDFVIIYTDALGNTNPIFQFPKHNYTQEGVYKSKNIILSLIDVDFC